MEIKALISSPDPFCPGKYVQDFSWAGTSPLNNAPTWSKRIYIYNGSQSWSEKLTSLGGVILPDKQHHSGSCFEYKATDYNTEIHYILSGSGGPGPFRPLIAWGSRYLFSVDQGRSYTAGAFPSTRELAANNKTFSARSAKAAPRVGRARSCTAVRCRRKHFQPLFIKSPTI